LIALEIPVLIIKIFSIFLLISTIYFVCLTAVTPRFVAPAFFFLNFSGFLFLSIGFKEEISLLAKDGAFIIFVSYILVLSFVIDQIEINKKMREIDKKIKKIHGKKK
tara:strand:- start:262 stop:582 length:321 start_codon:yes stop_codon:yes gene_type:complete